MLKRMLRPTNRRVRLAVGLFLAGLFCIQCTRTEAFKDSEYIVSISGKDFGANSPKLASEVERLAKTDQIALLSMCLDNYNRSYSDFTCTFEKEERINGTARAAQEIEVKHLAKPFCVAMAWTRNAPVGDRVLYDEGGYGGKMIVRPKSAFLQAITGGAVLRKPDGPDAMKNTLRPVNVFGFGRSLESLIAVYDEARDNGDLKTAFGGYADVAGRKCVVLIRYLPAKEDYPSYKTLVYIDVEHLVPICIEGYDWDEQLQCRYLYRDVKYNVGLTEDDFTPQANGITMPS
jgi:hypothetical protein